MCCCCRLRLRRLRQAVYGVYAAHEIAEIDPDGDRMVYAVDGEVPKGPLSAMKPRVAELWQLLDDERQRCALALLQQRSCSLPR